MSNGRGLPKYHGRLTPKPPRQLTVSHFALLCDAARTLDYVLNCLVLYVGIERVSITTAAFWCRTTVKEYCECSG